LRSCQGLKNFAEISSETVCSASLLETFRDAKCQIYSPSFSSQQEYFCGTFFPYCVSQYSISESCQLSRVVLRVVAITLWEVGSLLVRERQLRGRNIPLRSGFVYAFYANWIRQCKTKRIPLFPLNSEAKL